MTSEIASFSNDWPYLLSLLIILAIEAFFSGSEMALISSDRLHLKRQAAAGSLGANKALALLSTPEKLLSTVLIGTSVSILLQGTITTLWAHSRLSPEKEYYAVAIWTPIILIFGELLPKTVFQRYSNYLASRVALPIGLFAKVLYPILVLIQKYTHWLAKQIKPIEDVVAGKHKDSHREILHYLSNQGQKETSLQTYESRMIRKILQFSRSAARNAFIPLVNVDAIEDTSTVEQALEVFKSHRHSRLPVYHSRVDNIVGVVHVFDLFLEKNRSKSIQLLMKEPYFAPENQKIDDLLITMQENGTQMAIIVDEYGGAVGIATVEDLVEEIVGDISDEYDSESALFKELDEQSYLVHASMEIDAINEILKLGIPTGNYETLAGFLLLQFNRIPEEGDDLYFGHLRFEIKKSTAKSIIQVLINRIEPL